MSLDTATRYGRAVSDLEMAAQGHLRNEDWDSEMREALGELKEVRLEMKREGSMAPTNERTAG